MRTRALAVPYYVVRLVYGYARTKDGSFALSTSSHRPDDWCDCDVFPFVSSPRVSQQNSGSSDPNAETRVPLHRVMWCTGTKPITRPLLCTPADVEIVSKEMCVPWRVLYNRNSELSSPGGDKNERLATIPAIRIPIATLGKMLIPPRSRYHNIVMSYPIQSDGLCDFITTRCARVLSPCTCYVVLRCLARVFKYILNLVLSWKPKRKEI